MGSGGGWVLINRSLREPGKLANNSVDGRRARSTSGAVPLRPVISHTSTHVTASRYEREMDANMMKGALIGAGLASTLCVALSSRSSLMRKERKNSGETDETLLGPLSLEANDSRRPFVIAFGGPSGSGKTTFCTKLYKNLKRQGINAFVISCDCYYRTMPCGQDPARYNFDEPEALELSLLAKHLRELRSGVVARIPKYCFKTHQRTGDIEKIKEVDVILVEGIFALCDKEVRDQTDLKIYVQEESDICLARRTLRDVKERGRQAENVIMRYQKFVKPAYDRYIKPSSQHADVIIPVAGRNKAATELIIRSILSYFKHNSGPCEDISAEFKTAETKEEK